MWRPTASHKPPIKCSYEFVGKAEAALGRVNLTFENPPLPRPENGVESEYFEEREAVAAELGVPPDSMETFEEWATAANATAGQPEDTRHITMVLYRLRYMGHKAIHLSRHPDKKIAQQQLQIHLQACEDIIHLATAMAVWIANQEGCA